MNHQIAIKVEDLSKKFTIGRQKEGTLAGTIKSFLKQKLDFSDEFWALRNVSFEVKQGEVLGIIGKNGAGKSTLLKLLSQISKPTSGKIQINGRIASLLEVGTGFHPELTGRENIYLNGTILGMSRREVKEKFDEIVDFSGVEKFIDTPVKHYSSGMYVRLAFAVAAHLEPEILIIDEVLAVGDSEFQKKCLGKMQDVAHDGRTVLFVSHHLGSIRQLCNKGMILKNGELFLHDEITHVISAYQKTGNKNTKYIADHSTLKELYIQEAFIDHDTCEFYHNERINFHFIINSSIVLVNRINLLVRILDEMDQVVGSFENPLYNGIKNYKFELEECILTKGQYKVNCIIYQPGVAQLDNVEELCFFEILDNNSEFAHLETFNIGKMYIPQKWEIK